MSRRIHKFETYEELEHKFKELVESGVSTDDITLYSPNPNHHFDDLIIKKDSPVKFFNTFGAILGCSTGLFITTYMSVWSWRIQTGDKGYFTLPPFMVIMFELTILIGCIVTLLGFLITARLPNPLAIISPEDYGNYFTIVVNEKDEK